MVIRRSMADYQQAGAGGIVFMGFLQAITLPISFEQRRILYRGLYSLIVAKIEDDPKYKDDPNIGLLVGATKILLDQAGQDYVSAFESHETYGPLENAYNELLAQIYDKLTQLGMKTKIIEKVTIEQDVIG